MACEQLPHGRTILMDVLHAVLDLGSNSFHLLVADVNRHGKLTVVLDEKELVRLGAPALRRSLIDPRGFERGLRAVGSLLDRARRFPRCRMVCVATSAVREAKNGGAFVKAIRKAHGLAVEVLDGPSEARLSYAGARLRTPEARGPIGVIDVGGGSVELAIGEEGLCLMARTLPIGVLRLRDALCPPDGILDHHHVQALAETVRGAAADIAREVDSLAPRRFLLTGGTPRRLAALSQRLGAERTSPGVLSRDAVVRTAVLLIGRAPEELQHLGVDPGRWDMMAPGAVILSTLMLVLGANRALIARTGLREGVVLRQALHPAPADRPPLRKIGAFPLLSR